MRIFSKTVLLLLTLQEGAGRGCPHSFRVAVKSVSWGFRSSV